MRASTIEVLLVLICLVGAPALQAQSKALRGKSDVSARQVFGVLRSTATAIPFSQDSWEKTLTENELVKKPGEPWSFRDATGEVRSLTFFTDEEASLFLLFFPEDSTPVPDPLLDYWLRNATSVLVDNGDSVTITLPPRQLSAQERRGTSTESLTLRATGGTLLRTTVAVAWRSR